MNENRVFDALTESMEETRRRERRIAQLEAKLEMTEDTLFYAQETILSMDLIVKQLKSELAECKAKLARQAPLEGEARSRILQRLKAIDIDDALAKVDLLEAKLKEAEAREKRLT